MTICSHLVFTAVESTITCKVCDGEDQVCKNADDGTETQCPEGTNSCECEVSVDGLTATYKKRCGTEDHDHDFCRNPIMFGSYGTEVPRTCYCAKDNCNACTIKVPEIKCNVCDGDLFMCKDKSDMGELLTCFSTSCACHQISHLDKTTNQTVHEVRRTCGPEQDVKEHCEDYNHPEDDYSGRTCYCKSAQCNACTMEDSSSSLQAQFGLIVGLVAALFIRY